MEVLGSPALIAGDGEGLLHHRTLSEGVGEIVTLYAFERRRGTALVDAYLERARADGLREVRVITTNDNVDALRFHQSRGLVIRAVRVNAMEAVRKLKPAIPPTGALQGSDPRRDRIGAQIVVEVAASAACSRDAPRLTCSTRSRSRVTRGYNRPPQLIPAPNPRCILRPSLRDCEVATNDRRRGLGVTESSVAGPA